MWAKSSPSSPPFSKLSNHQVISQSPLILKSQVSFTLRRWKGTSWEFRRWLSISQKLTKYLKTRLPRWTKAVPQSLSKNHNHPSWRIWQKAEAKHFSEAALSAHLSWRETNCQMIQQQTLLKLQAKEKVMLHHYFYFNNLHKSLFLRNRQNSMTILLYLEYVSRFSFLVIDSSCTTDLLKS